MKTYNILFAVMSCFILGSVSAQENKTISEEAIVSHSDSIEGLLKSQSFEFIAKTVYPLSGSPKNVVGSDYSVTFSPEMVVSNLPFFGRAYSGMKMGRDKGMRFKGKPENFQIEKAEAYQVSTLVNDGDTYKISLSLSNSGNATLTISSNSRGTISYQGDIVHRK